ncbi:PREDICTED: uncharacterized protein At5g41620-like isoform X1 [Lupinus angustifolius]|nr:PREDICTED: uncharacterized protein At5g41620-like isoform X1 [Lupinus angustifolius]
MERREKVLERGARRIMVEKLKEGIMVGKRGSGPCTPSPTWRLELPSQQNGGSNNVQEFLNFPTSSTISARKLCANLWEFQPHQQETSLNGMDKSAATLRCRRRRCKFTEQVAESPDSSSNQPTSASSCRSHVSASFVQRHRSIERNDCAPYCESPASYNSSVDVAPYNHTVTPTNSLGFKNVIGESSHSVKTSTKFVKILNRIWTLEEQHASNISVVKALKMELGHSQAQMKELLREKQMNRQEMENLMKQITVDKLFKKNKERDIIKSTILSIKEELEDERRLRKHSESLHCKLARELSEVKSSFSGCLRNLERDRKTRILLENLCDEFAKGIKAYEQEVSCLRRNSENGQVQENDSPDKLILHISEAWLDERMQMKQTGSSNDLKERNSIVDKLGFDIETFLCAKRSVDLKKYGYSSLKELKEIRRCQHSFDSFPQKEATSTPHNMAPEDSINTVFYEPKMTAGEEVQKLSPGLLQCNNATDVHLEKKGKQVQSKEINKTISCDDNETCFLERKSSEKMEGDNIALIKEDAKQGSQESVLNSSDRADNLIGNSSLSSEGDKVYPESICRADSCAQSSVTASGSSVKVLKSKLSFSDFDMSECSTKLPKGVKENTLMAKLLEARLEGQKSRSIASKSTS